MEGFNSADLIMVLLYWILTVFWFIVFIVVIFQTRHPFFRILLTKDQTKIMIGMILLSFIFLTDSFFWSIATTGRIGLYFQEISRVLYDSKSVITIKVLFLCAAILFITLISRIVRGFESLNRNPVVSYLVENMGDAVGILNRDGVVLHWNQAAHQLFGWSSNFTQGKHIKEFLVPKEKHAEIDKVLKDIEATGHTINAYKTERFTSNRDKIDIDLTISPMNDFSGEFVGFFGVMRPTRSLPSSCDKEVEMKESTPGSTGDGTIINIENSTVGVVSSGIDASVKAHMEGISMLIDSGHKELATCLEEIEAEINQENLISETQKKNITDFISELAIQASTPTQRKSNKPSLELLFNSIEKGVGVSDKLISLWSKAALLLKNIFGLIV